MKNRKTDLTNQLTTTGKNTKDREADVLENITGTNTGLIIVKSVR